MMSYCRTPQEERDGSYPLDAFLLHFSCKCPFRISPQPFPVDSVAEGSCPLFQITRLNQLPLVLNSDLIEYIEITPDTVITLTTGQKIMVRESAD